MPDDPSARPSRAEQRRQRREAEQRRQRWDDLRAPDAAPVPAPSLPPLVSTAAPAADSASAPRARRGATAVLLSAVLPALTAALAVATVAAAVPLYHPGWELWALAGGAVLTAGAAFASMRAARAGLLRGRAALVSVAVGILLIAGFSAGAMTQVVVGGKAQLAGSVGDRTYRQATAALSDAAVLAENQKLLRLPPEQAKALLGTFDEAIAQDTGLAARWNPAVATDLPTPALAETYRLLNAAATRQAEALAAQKQNLLSPDTQLAAIVAEGYEQVAAVLPPQDGAGTVASSVQVALAEAGLDERTGP